MATVFVGAGLALALTLLIAMLRKLDGIGWPPVAEAERVPGRVILDIAIGPIEKARPAARGAS